MGYSVSKGFPASFLQQHLNRTFGSSFLLEEVDTYAVGDVAFLGRMRRWAHRFASFRASGAMLSDGCSHAGCAEFFRGNDVHFCLEHVCARVLCVHTGYCRDAQLFLYGIADGAAGNTVTSGVECRSCNEYIRAVCSFTSFQNVCLGLVQVLVEVGVAADDCG